MTLAAAVVVVEFLLFFSPLSRRLALFQSHIEQRFEARVWSFLLLLASRIIKTSGQRFFDSGGRAGG